MQSRRKEIDADREEGATGHFKEYKIVRSLMNLTRCHPPDILV